MASLSCEIAACTRVTCDSCMLQICLAEVENAPDQDCGRQATGRPQAGHRQATGRPQAGHRQAGFLLRHQNGIYHHALLLHCCGHDPCEEDSGTLITPTGRTREMKKKEDADADTRPETPNDGAIAWSLTNHCRSWMLWAHWRLHSGP